MKIIFAGGTGFIGSALTQALVDRGDELILLSRSSSKKSDSKVRICRWDPSFGGGAWEKELDGADAVINLAGEPITQRWTPAKKTSLCESRVQSVRAVIRAISKAKRRPRVLLNASAVGYYGSRGDEILDENSKPGFGFLPELCRQWEDEVVKAELLGIRAIRIRIGIVLGKGGGALQKMLPPFRLGIGGPLGSGKQWMSWIHQKDIVRLILFLLDRAEASGPFNAVSPDPSRMTDFAKTLGAVLRRPAIFPVPAFVLKILLGEMSEMLLTGQRVLPQRAAQSGFSFQFPTLKLALEDILK